MRTFRVSRAADADLRKIAEHTLKVWGEIQRDAYIAELFDAFEHLPETPKMATSADFIREGYRKFPQGSHVVSCRVSDTHSVEIIRVLHKRMDAEAHLGSP